MSHRIVNARLAAVATAAAVALAACTPASTGTDASADPDVESTVLAGPAEAPAGTVDPCELLTAKRLKKLTGTSFAQGTFNSTLSGEGRNLCTWYPENEERSYPRLSVEINWEFPDPVQHREIATDLFGKTANVKSGIEGAEEPYFLPGKTTLGMGVGDYFVKVSYTPSGNSQQADRLKKIAREIVKNLDA